MWTLKRKDLNVHNSLMIPEVRESSEEESERPSKRRLTRVNTSESQGHSPRKGRGSEVEYMEQLFRAQEKLVNEIDKNEVYFTEIDYKVQMLEQFHLELKEKYSRIERKVKSIIENQLVLSKEKIIADLTEIFGQSPHSQKANNPNFPSMDLLQQIHSPPATSRHENEDKQNQSIPLFESDQSKENEDKLDQDEFSGESPIDEASFKTQKILPLTRKESKGVQRVEKEHKLSRNQSRSPEKSRGGNLKKMNSLDMDNDPSPIRRPLKPQQIKKAPTQELDPFTRQEGFSLSDLGDDEQSKKSSPKLSRLGDEGRRAPRTPDPQSKETDISPILRPSSQPGQPLKFSKKALKSQIASYFSKLLSRGSSKVSTSSLARDSSSPQLTNQKSLSKFGFSQTQKKQGQHPPLMNRIRIIPVEPNDPLPLMSTSRTSSRPMLPLERLEDDGKSSKISLRQMLTEPKILRRADSIKSQAHIPEESHAGKHQTLAPDLRPDGLLQREQKPLRKSTRKITNILSGLDQEVPRSPRARKETRDKRPDLKIALLEVYQRQVLKDPTPNVRSGKHLTLM